MRTLAFTFLALASAVGQSDVQSQLESQLKDIEYAAKPLEDVVNEIHGITDINFFMSAAVREKDIKVTIKMKRCSVRTLLNFIAKGESLFYYVDDGILYLKNGSEANDRLKTVMISVKDLVFKITNYPGPDLVMDDNGTKFVPGQPEPSAGDLDVPELVKSYTCGKSWEELPDASVTLSNGTLVVKQTPEGIKEINQFLGRLHSIK